MLDITNMWLVLNFKARENIFACKKVSSVELGRPSEMYKCIDNGFVVNSNVLGFIIEDMPILVNKKYFKIVYAVVLLCW